MPHNQLATDLASEIEAATEGSRELSDRVLEVLGWAVADDKNGRPFWWHPKQPKGWIGKSFTNGQQPHPTCSETDAFALVPPTMCVALLTLPNGKVVAAMAPSASNEPPELGDNECATPALALSAALVRAVGEQR